MSRAKPKSQIFATLPWVNRTFRAARSLWMHYTYKHTHTLTEVRTPRETNREKYWHHNPFSQCKNGFLARGTRATTNEVKWGHFITQPPNKKRSSNGKFYKARMPHAPASAVTQQSTLCSFPQPCHQCLSRGKPYILGCDVFHSFGHLERKAEEVFSIQGQVVRVL